MTNSAINLAAAGQPAPPGSWTVSNWAAAQSSLVDWSAANVTKAADGAAELRLGPGPAGAPRPFRSGEIQSADIAATGTFSWSVQAPRMVSGSVFALFAYQADWKATQRLEFDLAFAGADTTRLELAVQLTGADGKRLANLDKTVIDLGFDAAAGVHSYDLVLTGTGAVVRVDGTVVAYFSSADMPGGVWGGGEMRSYVDLWAADSASSAWAGAWTYPGQPLVGLVTGASVRAGDLGGAMPRLGSALADSLTGTAGLDVIDGLAGDDRLDGGAGNDRVMGGTGNDTLLLDAGNDVLNGGPGQDWIRAIGTAAISLDLLNNWGSQATGRGRDSIRNVEHAAGGAGNDTLAGTDGANSLLGGDGADQLYGRGGPDVLVGGPGCDLLDGGADAARDLFVFAAAAESGIGATQDVVANFRPKTDDLDLRGIDARPLLAGQQPLAWAGTTATPFSVWFARSGEDLIVRGDVSGDRIADFEIRLRKVATAIDAADLLLV